MINKCLLISYGFIIFAICFFIVNIPIKINNKTKTRIESYGLSHITPTENINKIIDNQGYANFKLSTKIKSYATFYKRAVFFFLGIPPKIKYVYNILGKGKEYSIIVIKPENIDQKILDNLYRRVIDGTIISFNEVKIKAEVQKLENLEGYKK